MEAIMGKIEIIWNWYYWYYEEILESFSEIISVRFGKNCEEILETLRKNMENISNKLWKNIYWLKFCEICKANFGRI